MTDPATSGHRRISIVVPCRNESNHIDGFISGVLQQEGLAADVEVLIADGRSTDDTRERIGAWSARDRRLRLIDNPEQTTSHGLNRAIAESSGDVIVRMDVHTEYAPDYVRQCIATLEATGADNVGGPARTKATTYFQHANRLAYHSAFAVGGARFHFEDYEGPVDTVAYGCWPRQIFERVGMFDTQFVRNQDDELNLRIARSGGRLWQNPAIRSWYYPRSTARDLFRQYMQYGYWKVGVIRKHHLPASWRHVVPGAFVAALSLAVAAAPFSRWAGVTAGLLAGAYAVASQIASLWTSARPGRWKYLPIMPLVFGCYHFGYAIGFLRGVWDFLVLRRGGGRAFEGLTR
jgi:glycosyltransferase involved in cell wall biosynthesis